MNGIDDFKSTLEGLLKKSEKEVEQQEAKRKEVEKNFETMLLQFDQHADLLQEKVIQPRMNHLSSLFQHATEPEVAEESEYRHRIHIHFNHTTEFPCTADVTFLIVHDEEPGFCVVKFEYLVLPAYVTDRFKVSDTKRVALGSGEHGNVAEFVESSIKTFITNYLKARRI